MIDPEAFEPTEEQFSASLHPENAHRARARFARRLDDGIQPAAGKSGIERTFAEREALNANLNHASEFWREEVASRLDTYRTRRSRKRLAGQFSMRLDFDRAAAAESLAPAAPQPAACPEPLANVLPEPCEPEPEPSRLAILPALPRDAKIIEFPRALVFPEFSEDPNALAETLIDRPRIVEVPEAVPASASPLAGIALEPAREDEPASQPAFELPLRVSPLPQRFSAALIDWLIVLVATATFAMIVTHSAPDLPHTKPMFGLALAAPVLFWAVYNYLFLVYAALTPGMQMAGIRLSTFDGGPPARALRRWRALAMVFSCASLSFGLLWAFFDEDNLCWHDKMTRTFLTGR